MKKITLWFLLVFFPLTSISAYADVYVHGYYRADGTYVKPRYRSDPDGDFNNNWSTKGNKNPHTGGYGTKSRKEQK